jgi:sugar lactone lactonase YvrE
MRAIACSLTVLSFLSFNPSALAHGFELVTAFDPSQGELPESVTLDQDGNMFISVANTIRKRTPDGSMSVFGILPVPGAFALGVKVGHDGCVYTASTSLDPAAPATFVWRICESGHVEQFAALDQTGAANDLAFDDEGNLFVTDPFLGQIWKVDPAGNSSVWLQHPLLLGNPEDPALIIRAFGVDGVAFDRGKRNLYVSNLDFGRILRVRVRCDGSAGVISIHADDPLLVGADGIAFDKRGTLFVAVGAQDRVVAVTRRGSVESVSQGGVLDGPSSIAFGTRPGGERTMYVTSLALLRAFGLVPGEAHPALVKSRVRHAGLPLP